MLILIACETSGKMRRAFQGRGHTVYSCDILPADDDAGHWHIQGDVRPLLTLGVWDMLIAHPPCTRLCNSGVRWLNDPRQKNAPDECTDFEKLHWCDFDIATRRVIMWRLLYDGLSLFNACWNAPVPRVCVENPVMHCYARERVKNWVKPQIAQPWHHGDKAFKATGLYLRGLPPLRDTDRLVPPARGTPEHKAWSRIHLAPPGADRWKIRSETFDGIASACAQQWG